MTPEPHSSEATNRLAGVLVFTATYDEIDNIDEWLLRVTQTVPEADVLVVDDGSPDGTGRRVEAFAQSCPRVALVERPGKAGVGRAHKVAFEYALERGYQILVTMDADLSHEPESIPGLMDALARADFVIGTRWKGGTCDYRGVRMWLSWLGNWTARVLINAPVSEYTTSFRAFSPEALRVVVADPPQDDGYAFFLDVVVDLHRHGMAMAEVPIHFKDRSRGRSKIPKAQVVTSSFRLLQRALVRKPRAMVDRGRAGADGAIAGEDLGGADAR